MNRRIVAGAALVAGIAIASPMLAWSAADSGPPTTQATPAQPGGAPGGGWKHGGWEHGGWEHGGWEHGGWEHGARGPMGFHRGWMRGAMMHRMMQMPPRQRCEERLARRAGMIAYTVAKLGLTASQRPLWDKLDNQLQAASANQRRLCQTLPATAGPGKATVLDRVARREQFLTARLQGLQQIRPALEQFYQALTADQKAIIDHPFKRG